MSRASCPSFLSSRAQWCAVAHASMPTRQGGRSAKNSRTLRSTNTPADYHRAICIDAVNLKHRLRNIDPDRANLAHGRLPSMWLRFDATTLWHIDAAEWAPSTTSFASIWHVIQVRSYFNFGHIRPLSNSTRCATNPHSRPRARGLARRDARRFDHVTLTRGAAALAVATSTLAVPFRPEASSSHTTR